MNRDKIIAKTLEDMRRYESPHGEEVHQRSEERDEYDLSVTIPELMKRLPDGEVLTCADFDFPEECCESCHYAYAHYDMELVDLPDGRKAWICCAVRRALFHEPDQLGGSEEVNLEEALGGGLRKRKDPDGE